jgi:hypothetical protein
VHFVVLLLVKFDNVNPEDEIPMFLWLDLIVTGQLSYGSQAEEEHVLSFRPFLTIIVLLLFYSVVCQNQHHFHILLCKFYCFTMRLIFKYQIDWPSKHLGIYHF